MQRIVRCEFFLRRLPGHRGTVVGSPTAALKWPGLRCSGPVARQKNIFRPLEVGRINNLGANSKFVCKLHTNCAMMLSHSWCGSGPHRRLTIVCLALLSRHIAYPAVCMCTRLLLR